MRFLKLSMLLVLVAFLATQPLVHHHTLSTERSAPPCSVCVFGAHTAVYAPGISGPIEVAHQYLSTPEAGPSCASPRHVSSRGPPTA